MEDDSLSSAYSLSDKESDNEDTDIKGTAETKENEESSRCSTSCSNTNSERNSTLSRSTRKSSCDKDSEANVESIKGSPHKNTNLEFDSTRGEDTSHCSTCSVTNSERDSSNTGSIRKHSSFSDTDSKSSVVSSTNDADKTVNADNDNLKRNFKFPNSDNSDNETDITIKCKDVNTEDINEAIDQVAKKSFKLIDSDSEDENQIQPKSIKNLTDSDSEVETNTSVKQKKKRIVLKAFKSDSESDNEPPAKSLMKNYAKLIDSDSEDNEESSIVTTEPVYALNSAKELVPETESTSDLQKRISSLCDPDTSEDDEKINPIVYKKKSKKGESSEKKMSAKEAQEQRKEIESTSQRHLRDRHVSLPYHKPKQRTLKEFLQNRPKFASAVPLVQKAPAALAIKMVANHLEEITRNIEQREKEVEEFFKSESETDEENENESKQLPTIENESKTLESDEILTEDKDNDQITENAVNEEQNNTENILKMKVENNDLNIYSEIENEVPKNDLEKENNVLTVCDKNDENLQTSDETMEPPTEKHSEIVHKEVHILENIIICPPNEGNKILGKKFDENSKNNKSKIDEEVDTTENEEIAVKIHKENLFVLDDDDDEDSMQVDINEESSEDNNPNKEEPKSRLDLLKEKLSNIQPRLSGGPNLIIDLDEGVTKPDEVTELMNRFIQHTAKKTHGVHKVALGITNVSSQGDIQKETLVINDEVDEAIPISEKPGVRFQQLKHDLQLQMAQQRTELWKQKHQTLVESKIDDSVFDGEKSDCGADELLDDEEEDEFTDIESTDDEEEDEEVEEIAESRKLKSEFVDDEADDEDEFQDNENEIDEENELHDEHIEEDEDNFQKPIEVIKPKKKLRRIIQPKDDDEDSENESEIKDFNTQCDSTLSLGDDEDNLPAGQTRVIQQTPQKLLSTQSRADLGFLSPVGTLTGLQSFDGTLNYQSPESPVIKLDDPSPLKTKGWQKSLFTETPKKKHSLEDLTHLCSGEFPSQATEEPGSIQKDQTSVTQDLLDVCSGEFTGISQIDEDNVLVSATVPESKETKDCKDKNQKSDDRQSDMNRLTEDDDKLISQLLNEEEMEMFKKKFESPVTEISNKNEILGNNKISTSLQFKDDDKDEEDDDGIEDEEIINFKQAKKQRKNVFNDSDSDEEIDQADDESIDLHDEDDDDIDNAEEIRNPSEIAYDSDENEIIVENNEAKKKKINLKEFIENEAELSESEWGSEDEDERNLDELDIEEGDTEKFNERKLKRDLEKIHMKQMLDEDKHKLKVLQELYMEDADLQGAGRQRQFRWKNIDYSKDEADENNPGEETGNVNEDDENEEEWRKKRFEREQFLKSQRKSVDEEPIRETYSDSQILKIGSSTIIKSTNTVANSGKEVNIQQKAFTVKTQRGSFLSRDDRVLAQIAEFTKVSEDVIGGAKNSRGFLFKSITNSTTSVQTTAQDKKRKAADGSTPLAIKKLRLNGLSPAQQKKGQSNTSKRLFSLK